VRPWPERADQPEGVRVELAGLSVTGPVRRRNEDHVGWAVPDDRVWVPARHGDERLPAAELAGPIVVAAVADGLGGHADGDLASRFAITMLLDRLGPPGVLRGLPDTLRDTYQEVNARLLAGEIGGEGAGARRLGAQTTLTAVAITAGSAWVSHVGDCRVFRLRDQALELLTTDHSQAMELLRMRLIRPEQAASHPGRHLLTRSLGGDISLRVDVRSGEVREGDAYLLCSDGAWSGLSSDDIIAALEGDLETGVGQLVDRSISRGGDDNASVIALRVLRVGEPPDASSGRRGLWRRVLGA
jgi:serine/threonine protein phosphatase PrpC